MLGLAPLAAIPLGSAFNLEGISEQMAATGGFTFGGSGNVGAIRRMSASGGISFGGSPFITMEFLASASGGLSFGGSPLLRVAGRPIIITAMYDNFTIRTMGEDWSPVALNDNLTVRGVPE